MKCVNCPKTMNRTCHACGSPVCRYCYYRGWCCIKSPLTEHTDYEYRPPSHLDAKDTLA